MSTPYPPSSDPDNPGEPTPQPGYGPPPAYGEPQPGYGTPGPPVYGQPQPGYQQQLPPGYDQPGQVPGYTHVGQTGFHPLPGAAPESYILWSILTTIACCPPFGLVAMFYASQVSRKWAAGDHEGARAASRRARGWAIAAGIGLLVSLVTIVLLSDQLLSGPTTSISRLR